MLTLLETLDHCRANDGGTFRVHPGTIAKRFGTDGTGKPSGVQNWSWNPELANQTGVLTGHWEDSIRSLELVGYEPFSADSGYMVSLRPVDEPKILYPCQASEFVVPELTDLSLYGYTVHHLDQFNVGAFLGVWFDQGKWYLDLSVHVPTHSRAVEFARYNKQLAIWDCHNQRSEPV